MKPMPDPKPWFWWGIADQINPVLSISRKYPFKHIELYYRLITGNYFAVIHFPGSLLPVPHGSSPAGPRGCSSRPGWNRQDRDDQGSGQGLSQAVRGLQLLRRSGLQDDGSILLRLGPVRRLVLLRWVQPNRYWGVVCHRAAADHNQKCKGCQGNNQLLHFCVQRQKNREETTYIRARYTVQFIEHEQKHMKFCSVMCFFSPPQNGFIFTESVSSVIYYSTPKKQK